MEDNIKTESWWEEQVESHHLVLSKLKGKDRAKYKQLAYGHFYGQQGNAKDMADLYMKVGIDVENHLINEKPPTDEMLLLC